MRTIDLEVTDWTQSRTATIPSVPSDITVEEILRQLNGAMSLSEDTSHYLVYDGQKVNGHQTLEEIGVEDRAEMTVAPEVTAG